MSDVTTSVVGGARVCENVNPAVDLALQWTPSLLVGGVLGVTCAVVPVAVCAVIWSTHAGIASVIVAAVLLLAYFVSGHLFDAVRSRLRSKHGALLIFCSYALRLAVLGMVFYLLFKSRVRVVWLDRTWFFFTALVVVIGWTAGLVKAHSKQRILIYDEPSFATSEAIP